MRMKTEQDSGKVSSGQKSASFFRELGDFLRRSRTSGGRKKATGNIEKRFRGTPITMWIG